ncbi:polyribonucleotide nucleotidyltransferase [Patescibacteria group bacterium]|jgi:polyribonucleotide nucleotidyltransferase|nr:polyribonucleotide nucleotidyltransferase [Patescibacteria group bacterium]
MIKPSQEFSIDWAGRKLTIGVGQLAQQANGSCTVRFGDTVVLATATLGEAKEGMDYFPLLVDFEERMYAAGRIKGSRFIKREGRPTDEAILSGRLIDRAIRPLFPDHFRNEVAVVSTVFSHDQENDADIPGLIGAACALAISDIPWNGPIAAIRVGRKDGKLVAMPTYQETVEGGLDLVVAGTSEKTLMVEAGLDRVSEADALEAMEFALKHLGPVIDLINKVTKAVGKTKMEPKVDAEEQAIRAKALEFFKTKRGVLFAEPLATKADRKAAIARLKKEMEDHLAEAGIAKEQLKKAFSVLDEYVDSETTNMILDEKRRADGRALNQVRELGAMVAVMPRTHGSGLFQRGSTQVLSSVTLGSPGMEQTLDTMEFQTTKRFFHHYNFPSYSVGETKGNRGPGRREIGHGALAERALMPVLPNREEFPYTVRVVSEVLGANGSSSMGATCGSTLALMDAGVPILEPVAGIAMGVASDEKTGRYQVITDLQDLEDGAGGMDFKIAGTKTGITAIQMDTKTSGLPWNVVKEAILQAREARLTVLKSITDCIPEVRSDLSKYAPRIVSFRINPEKIRDVIGPGGKMINEIINTHKVEIDIEDDGLVMVTSVNQESMQKAVEWIKQLTREVQVGEVFEGPVVRIMAFGAFVQILPKVDGLVHISEMALNRVEKVEDVVNIGDMVKVVVTEIDGQGRINLSMKRLDPGYVPSDRDNKPLRTSKGPRR